MNDLSDRNDIKHQVDTFYGYMHADPLMAPFFNIPTEEMERHLERTYNFWDNWLFQTGSYKGGLMWAHLEKNEQMKMTTTHFEHWLAHWFRALDENFQGPNADFLKSKALELGQFINRRLNPIDPQRTV